MPVNRIDDSVLWIEQLLPDALNQLSKAVAKFRRTSPQTPLHLERGFRSTIIDSARKPKQSPELTPSPRGEGRGEVKRKATCHKPKMPRKT